MTALLRQLRRVIRLLWFSLWFAWLVVLASVEVAVDVLTPRSRLATGILAYAADSRTPAELAVFAALVNLTPGTLVVALRDAQQVTVYVHAMYAPDPRTLDRELRHLEARFLRAVRLNGGRP
ncbi:MULTISPECIES: Na+/H+ antiporter subunit E [Microbacterium]|jgi:multicomponent Na+:H+ antiporter subunit E|uniref:Na+/H+ antiporter subunit E n=1 Tax=Microbacterium TaxID=33882 RepID=UPI00248EAE8F|nr:Na+/H+ antiporter subunit E [Microbacterium aurum]MBZ6371359.1 Na+/H+ antiporter subunit E [Microbacterium hominis]